MAMSSRREIAILSASYVFDWFIMLVIGLLAYAFNQVTPNYHPFSLLDLSISYPVIDETVSISSLILASIVAPAIIIFLVCMFLVPGPAELKRLSKAEISMRKLWEWNVGWLGLALAILTELMVVSAVKNIIGKPRPLALAQCIPDLNAVAQHTVGGYGTDLSSRWVLVDYHICQQSNPALLKDAFRSFPSGHSATAFSGLLYLTFYLVSKLGAPIPIVPITAHFRRFGNARPFTNGAAAARLKKSDEDEFRENRDEAAAAPTWLALVMYIPLGVAVFISGSRYFNYKHHGFDVLSGSLLGIVTGWFGFRWYHPALAAGSGWAWGNRSPGRAFGVGVGNHGYVAESSSSWFRPAQREDLEMGPFSDQQQQSQSQSQSQQQRLSMPPDGNAYNLSSPTSTVHNDLPVGGRPAAERSFT